MAGTEAGRGLLFLPSRPAFVGDLAERLQQWGYGRMRKSRSWFEKPFGRDSRTAQALKRRRWPRYFEKPGSTGSTISGLKRRLAKPVAVRLGSMLFEPCGTANNVDHIQITVAETSASGAGVNTTTQSGCHARHGQNQPMQLLCCIANGTPRAVLIRRGARVEKLKVIRAFWTPCTGILTFARGQYQAEARARGRTTGYAYRPWCSRARAPKACPRLKTHISNWRMLGTALLSAPGKTHGRAHRPSLQSVFKKRRIDFTEDGGRHRKRLSDPTASRTRSFTLGVTNLKDRRRHAFGDVPFGYDSCRRIGPLGVGTGRSPIERLIKDVIRGRQPDPFRSARSSEVEPHGPGPTRSSRGGSRRQNRCGPNPTTAPV